MIPKEMVMKVNQIRGPITLTAIVAGNWNITLAIVYTMMEMDCKISTSIAAPE
jgi:hypothetical protein